MHEYVLNIYCSVHSLHCVHKREGEKQGENKKRERESGKERGEGFVPVFIPLTHVQDVRELGERESQREREKVFLPRSAAGKLGSECFIGERFLTSKS